MSDREPPAKLRVSLGLALLGAACNVAHADNMGTGVGAVRGAIVGDLIAGPGGAAAGAAIGAMIGAPGAAAEKQAHMDQKQAEADARLGQWETERRARELAATERRAEAAHLATLDSGPDLDLLLDAQRALIGLGYDPGPIGITSPELTTAIVRYQESAGLLPDGRLSQELLDGLIESSQ